MDPLKYAPHHIDGGGQKLFKELDSEAPEHNRESTSIKEESF